MFGYITLFSGLLSGLRAEIITFSFSFQLSAIKHLSYLCSSLPCSDTRLVPSTNGRLYWGRGSNLAQDLCCQKQPQSGT